MGDKVIRPNFKDRQRRKQPPKRSHRQTAAERDTALQAAELMDPIVRHYAVQQLLREHGDPVTGEIDVDVEPEVRIPFTEMLAAKKTFPEVTIVLDKEAGEVVITLGLAAEARDDG